MPKQKYLWKAVSRAFRLIYDRLRHNRSSTTKEINTPSTFANAHEYTQLYVCMYVGQL